MEAFKTQNGNFIVKNYTEYGFFSKDGVFLRYSDESEYEYAKTWGTDEATVCFKFPEGEHNSPFSKEFFIKKLLELNGVEIEEIDNLRFVDSFDFEIPKFLWLQTISTQGIYEKCDWYEPAGNNMYDKGGYSYFELRMFEIEEETYSVLCNYVRFWDWGDEPKVTGEYTIIKGNFINQMKDVDEKTNSFAKIKGIELLKSSLSD